jgi:hypothetical protein
MFTSIKRAAASLGAIVAIGFPAVAPVAAVAQTNASGANERPAVVGRITSIPGKYSLTVRNSRGNVYDVELHQGTIINPTGITLQPGFRVQIYGYRQNGSIVANEIDTPYDYAQQSYAPYYYGPYDSGFWGGPGWYGYGGPVIVPAPIVIIRRPP